MEAVKPFISPDLARHPMKIFYIDLFSGAGGTTTGIHLTNNPNIEVVACVNHDALAIESHKANHPNCLHFVEDVRDMKVIKALANLVRKLRNDNPDCIIIIWASLECTNYSKAKGGMPRDADSRTLAYSLYDYNAELNPDFVMIENVREFMSWGPLDESGRPLNKLNGREYIHWVKKMCSYGYDFDYKILNSADFGAYTSRERFFAQFAKDGLPIVWPEATHGKTVNKGSLFENTLKLWNPVREVLDLDDEGTSIFNRKKPLVDATLERIYAGLVKFVAGGEAKFMVKYNSMNINGKYKAPGINEPCPVISTQNRLGIVDATFLTKNYSGHPKSKAISIEKPSGAITTIDHHSLVKALFLTSYYGKSIGAQSIKEPCPTVTTKDRFASIFIDYQYGNGKPNGINKPVGSITGVPKLNMVKWIMDTNFKNVGSSLNEPNRVITASHKQHYLLNPQFNDKGRDLDRPCFTLIAKMDKRPPYIVQTETGRPSIEITNADSPIMVKIKNFMVAYGIIDIKMRMLKILELLKIQGFPEGYILKGSQANQKKFIGNAVVPMVAKAIAEANSKALMNVTSKKQIV